MIIKVAVPPPKHSPKFGHCASSHTVANLCSRKMPLILLISGDAGSLTRIQSGLRGNSRVGITFTGMRATLSAPRSFSPGTTLRGLSLIAITRNVRERRQPKLVLYATIAHSLCQLRY